MRLTSPRNLVLTATALLTTIAVGHQANWSLYALGGYSVALPGAPLAQSSRESPEAFRAWSAALGPEKYEFSLTKVATEDAKAPPETLLRQCVAGIVSAGDGSISVEHDLLLNGWPGIEVHYRASGGNEVQFRAFIVKNQIVNLIETRPAGGVPPRGFARYFDSIKLPTDVDKGSLLQPGPKIEAYTLEGTGFSAKVPTGAKGETAKGGGPGAVDMHIFSAAYVNRLYMGFVFDPPPNAKKDLDDDATGRAAQAVNTVIAGMLRQTVTKSDSKDRTPGKAWTAEFDAGHGLAGHLETYVRNNHTYSILAVVPASMMDSDEVTNFFSSVGLPTKQ